jgi:hypothetical protein
VWTSCTDLPQFSLLHSKKRRGRRKCAFCLCHTSKCFYMRFMSSWISCTNLLHQLTAILYLALKKGFTKGTCAFCLWNSLKIQNMEFHVCLYLPHQLTTSPSPAVRKHSTKDTYAFCVWNSINHQNIRSCWLEFPEPIYYKPSSCSWKAAYEKRMCFQSLPHIKPTDHRLMLAYIPPPPIHNKPFLLSKRNF